MVLSNPVFWLGVSTGLAIFAIAALAIIFLTHEEERNHAEPFPIYQPGVKGEDS